MRKIKRAPKPSMKVRFDITPELWDPLSEWNGYNVSDLVEPINALLADGYLNMKRILPRNHWSEEMSKQALLSLTDEVRSRLTGHADAWLFAKDHDAVAVDRYGRVLRVIGYAGPVPFVGVVGFN